MVPQILNPMTGKMINLYSDDVNQLLLNGFKEKELCLQSRLDPLKYNRQSLSDDILFNIMMYSDVDDIVQLSMLDKNANQLYHANHFWKLKIEKDLISFNVFNVYEYVKIQKVLLKVDESLKQEDLFYNFNNIEDMIKIGSPKMIEIIKNHPNVEPCLEICNIQSKPIITISIIGNDIDKRINLRSTMEKLILMLTKIYYYNNYF